jgi:hypothetical protein
MFDAPKKCNVEQPKMSTLEEFRLMFNHGSKAFVKGLYQADHDLI